MSTQQWETWKLAHAYPRIGSGTTPTSSVDDYYSEEAGVPWVTTAELRENYIEQTASHVTPKALKDFSSLRVYDAGSLMIAMYGATIGRLGITTIPATCNQACCVFEKSRQFDNRFLFYWLWHRRSDLVALSAGGGQPNLSQQDLREERALCPPLETQRRIARFLDEKTARIDALIEKKRVLLERLAEQRQALITRAVTKGLNPDAPMKSSGIDWLGDIPAHWELVPLKRLGHVRSGVTKGKSYNNEETVLLPYLRVANVQNGWLDLDEVSEIEVRKSDAEKYSLKYGDILMNEGGDNDKLGRGAIWRSQISPCLHQNHVFAVRLDLAEPEWVARCTEAAYAKFHFFRRAVQSTNLASISRSVVEDLSIPLPPEVEINEILKFLHSELLLISRLIEKVNQTISLQTEYRSALITAAVTGQLSLDAEPAELVLQEA